MESMSGWTPSSQNPAQSERSLNNIISTKYIMNKSYLEQLSKSELIELLLRKNKPTPAPRTKTMVERPIPTPRKSVKQMVQEYEDNIIPPPLEFIEMITNQHQRQAQNNEIGLNIRFQRHAQNLLKQPKHYPVIQNRMKLA